MTQSSADSTKNSTTHSIQYSTTDYIIALTSGSIANYMLQPLLETFLAFLPAKWEKKIPIYLLHIAIAFLTLPLACKIVKLIKNRVKMISHHWIVQKITSLIFVTISTYIVSYLLLLIPSCIYAYWFIEPTSVPQLLADNIKFFLEYYRYVLGISLLINMIGFVLGYLFHTDKLTDLSYSLSFLTVSSILYWLWPTHSSGLFGVGWVYMTIVLWAIRLGGFLFIRIRHQKKDARFDSMRGSFVKFGGFWLLQAISVCIILFSTSLFFSKKNTEKGISYSIGWLVLSLFGLILESVADWQKYSFKKKKENRGKFIQTGLWRFSRHPNYLGEILFWLGIFLTQLPSFTCWEIALATLTPLMISTLLLFISGIPLLEYKAKAKWGEDPEYQAYEKNTSGLIPYL